MIKAIGIAALAGGVVLLVMGLKARDSIGSQAKELFTGSPSDNAVWLLTAGVILAVGGIGAFIFASKK